MIEVLDCESIAFPSEGDRIEMFYEGKWYRGTVVRGHRYHDGVVTMRPDNCGFNYICCGEDRTDIYREVDNGSD